MPTNRRPINRLRRGLTWNQELELEFGPNPRLPGFSSEEARQQAWLRHRERLMQAWAKHGKRPWAWWQYESPIRFPRNSEYEGAALYEAGLLGEREKAELLAEWHEYFDRAQEPDFCYCIGHRNPGDTFASYLKGAAAKRAHYQWAGIPKELIRKWTAERRRRARTIRRLTQTAADTELIAVRLR